MLLSRLCSLGRVPTVLLSTNTRLSCPPLRLIMSSGTRHRLCQSIKSVRLQCNVGEPNEHQYRCTYSLPRMKRMPWRAPSLEVVRLACRHGRPALRPVAQQMRSNPTNLCDIAALVFISLVSLIGLLIDPTHRTIALGATRLAISSLERSERKRRTRRRRRCCSSGLDMN